MLGSSRHEAAIQLLCFLDPFGTQAVICADTVRVILRQKTVSVTLIQTQERVLIGETLLKLGWIEGSCYNFVVLNGLLTGSDDFLLAEGVRHIFEFLENSTIFFENLTVDLRVL